MTLCIVNVLGRLVYNPLESWSPSCARGLTIRQSHEQTFRQPEDETRDEHIEETSHMKKTSLAFRQLGSYYLYESPNPQTKNSKGKKTTACI